MQRRSRTPDHHQPRPCIKPSHETKTVKRLNTKLPTQPTTRHPIPKTFKIRPTPTKHFRVRNPNVRRFLFHKRLTHLTLPINANQPPFGHPPAHTSLYTVARRGEATIPTPRATPGGHPRPYPPPCRTHSPASTRRPAASTPEPSRRRSPSTGQHAAQVGHRHDWGQQPGRGADRVNTLF